MVRRIEKNQVRAAVPWDRRVKRAISNIIHPRGIVHGAVEESRRDGHHKNIFVGHPRRVPRC